MITLIYLFIIGSAALILMGLVTSPKMSAKKILLPQEEAQLKRIKTHSILASILPFSPKILEKLRLDLKIKNRLDAGHLKLTAVEFFNLKLLLMVLLAGLAPLFIGKADPLVIVVALAFGYIIPDIWVNKKISQRKYQIARLLPETVDLLGLCVEAGLDFTTAVKWLIEKTPANPMVEELSFVLEEIKWGKPRTQSLKDMSKRLSIPEVSSFVQTLVQAERMGTPVAEAFSILSEDTRLQRFHRGERYAMQAPIKILIPLIFCILPVIAIVIGGPIFLQFMQGGILKGLGK